MLLRARTRVMLFKSSWLLKSGHEFLRFFHLRIKVRLRFGPQWNLKSHRVGNGRATFKDRKLLQNRPELQKYSTA